MASRWLFKSEPSSYSFQRLQRDKKTVWDGVKNNLALKYLSGVKNGDWVLIYHTGDEKSAVGVAQALGAAYPDPEKEDPKLVVVDVRPIEPLSRPVTLAEMKANPKLAKFDLLRLPRLSIMPVSAEQWRVIEQMGRK